MVEFIVIIPMHTSTPCNYLSYLESNTMKGEQEKYIIKIWNVTTWKYILEIFYVGDASDLIFYQMIRVCDTFQVGAKVELWDKIMSYQSKSFEAKPLMTSSDEINLYI